MAYGLPNDLVRSDIQVDPLLQTSFPEDAYVGLIPYIIDKTV